MVIAPTCRQLLQRAEAAVKAPQPGQGAAWILGCVIGILGSVLGELCQVWLGSGYVVCFWWCFLAGSLREGKISREGV